MVCVCVYESCSLPSGPDMNEIYDEVVCFPIKEQSRVSLDCNEFKQWGMKEKQYKRVDVGDRPVLNLVVENNQSWW